ncbi:hypothetical protein [Cohnella zeiphila]|uniref:Copper amine oxidase-like N-terminal domain-containing protein n=1 Tax=Cohnella zeiphila TaxID=2761120 RepID=A0A7X0SNB7_9BACL|nr:hypothetical protein [Cohnella zeiphila]MBB6731880.1 hypothetical protein [Cohnella zeiphila]
MKKKILFVTLLSFLVVGSAQAGSIWGQFKGNPIVNLKLNGKEVGSDKVPAIAIDGRTYVPLVTIGDLGLSYSYDATTQSVNVVNPAADTTEPTPTSTPDPTGSPEPTPTPDPTATPTPTPSPTPDPEATPTPTPSPTPTPTPTPSPTPTIPPINDTPELKDAACQQAKADSEWALEQYREGKITYTNYSKYQDRVIMVCPKQ